MGEPNQIVEALHHMQRCLDTDDFGGAVEWVRKAQGALAMEIIEDETRNEIEGLLHALRSAAERHKAHLAEQLEENTRTRQAVSHYGRRASAYGAKGPNDG